MIVADLSVFGDALQFLVDNPGLIVGKALDQLALAGAALAIALVIALPLGVLLGHLHRGSFLAITAANLGRALPTLAVIAICLAFLPVGFVPVLIALVVLAIPPILTNAYVSVDEVEADVVEAARGMGMTERQLLGRVELPLATPLLFTGIRTAAVYVIASATIAAIAGGGGLGDIIVNQASYRIAGVIAASIVVSLLALGADALLALVQHGATPPPLRGRRVADTMLVPDAGEADPSL